MTSSNLPPPSKSTRRGWRRYMPALQWLPRYRRRDFAGDLIAGILVAIMLVPQSMAYALVAGLPPQVGLYASILPLILYGLFGTSRTLAVGPVAIVSLLVTTGLTPLAEPGSAAYVQLALTLALLVGLLQVGMGLLRLGFLVNFLSQPVLAGFTSAAAIIIGFSQVKHVFGIHMPPSDAFYQQVSAAVQNIGQTNGAALALSAGSILGLLYFKSKLGKQLKQWDVPVSIAAPLTKSGPLVIVLLGTLIVWLFDLHATAGVNIVGAVPAGAPPLTLPTRDLATWERLLPPALIISFVGYMESISVAKSLASKRRQKVDANQELVALGLANLGATFTGGYPVAGGISRSIVNFAAGANSGLASIMTAALIGLTVIFLTPLFYFLPQATLAAIIIVAVFSLVDIKTFRHVWGYNKADAAAMLITFAAVLAAGVETGILIGVAAAMLLFIWRTSKPHVAIVGRLNESEIYLNVRRYSVQTWPEVVAIRIDESLYFTNTKYLEDIILSTVAEQPAVKHLVLIGTAINFIDASALETLESLWQELHDAGVTLHLAAMKEPVMDRLQKTEFLDHVGPDHIHLSTHDAMKAIGCVV